jgi:hypothetical protein
MQNQKSDFAQKFLLEFTKQLIEISKPQIVIELEQKEKIPKPEEIKHLENLKIPKKLIKQKIVPIQKKFPIKKLPIKTIPQKLTIPKIKLPPRFQNIQPVSTKREIDLGKLNPILEDQTINSIECYGPNVPITIITRTDQKRNTKIVLTKEEIDKVINTFSTITRIPALEGVYKVAAGNLVLLSSISEIIGTKFVIRKIPQLTKIPKQRMLSRKMPPKQPLRPIPQNMIRR